MKLVIGICLSLVALPAFAQLPRLNAEQAALFELNQTGLNVLANELKREHLLDVDGDKLPDYEDKLDYGVKVKVEDLSYWIKFHNFQLVAEKNQLRAIVKIKDVKVHAARMKFRKRVLQATLKTTCRDTTIQGGFDGALNLEASVPMTVRDGQIALSINNARFRLPDDNYKVSGPKRCSGDLGVGSLVKLVIKQVLQRSQEKIEDAVKRQVLRVGPQLQARLNELTQQSLDLDLTQKPPLPQVQVSIVTAPYRIRIQPNLFRFELSATIAPADKTVDFVDTYEKAIGKKLGAIGMNPALLGELMFAVLGQQDPVELSEDQVPQLDEILNVRSAAAIWPDLTEISPSDDRLRVQMSLAAPPRIEVSDTDHGIQFEIPKIKLNFFIALQGKWLRYFDMELDLIGAASITQNGSTLLVSLTDAPEVVVRGNWAEGYQPRNDMFEQDVAELILSTVFEYLYASGPLARFTLPTFTVGNQNIKLSRPGYEGPFIKLNVDI